MITVAFFSLPGLLIVIVVLLFLLPSSVIKRGAGSLANRLGRAVGNLASGGVRPRLGGGRPRELTLLEVDEADAKRILGLRDPVTAEDIKRRWRELSKQYHPDQVHHLGPKLKAVAEREMKEINAAYDCLRKRYGV